METTPISHKSFLINKVLKIFLKIILVLIIFIGITYTSIGLYISSNKENSIKDINLAANEGLSGDVKIGGLEVLFFREFPNLTL